MANFDVVALHSSMQKCLLDNNDILLISYLEVFKGLETFCQLLGSIFGYVKDEIAEKSQILQDLSSQETDKFRTLKSMVMYEKESDLLKKGGYTSGSRTLLRLHRGLDFIREFIREVHGMNANGSIGSIGREVYDKTLGIYHPWHIRLGASVAMCVLPAREGFMQTLCGGTIDPVIVDQIPSMLEVADEIYRRTQTVYQTNGLLDLP